MSITSSPNAVGTLRWTAPGILEPDRFELEHAVATLKTDVYSFGMVMWEVCTKASLVKTLTLTDVTLSKFCTYSRVTCRTASPSWTRMHFGKSSLACARSVPRTRPR